MRFRRKAAVAAAGVCFVLRSLAPAQVAPPTTVDTKNLTVAVDPVACRWSASVKGTPMQINDVHFLPGGDASGWTVTSSVNQNDANNLGSFVTVTLRGKKAGQLDFEYQISASRTNNDILLSLGRTNNTGKEVDIDEMDYFISNDARLGSTSDRWISLGTQSRNRDYYDLWSVINLNVPKTYAVNHVVQDSDTGNSLLMGHVTTTKGASRFDLANGWKGKTPDRMRVRGYCSYNVTMPPGKSFSGERLLIYFNADALRAMEHQADLSALAHDIRLKERRPIDIDDRDWVSNDYSRFHGWMSGSGRGGGGGRGAGAGGQAAGGRGGGAGRAATIELPPVNKLSAPSDLKITDMRSLRVAANYDYPIIRIDTNQGLYGLGEVRDAGSEYSALAMKPFLVGRNPLDFDTLMSCVLPYAGSGRAGGGARQFVLLGPLPRRLRSQPWHCDFGSRRGARAGTPALHGCPRGGASDLRSRTLGERGFASCFVPDQT